jgi:Ca-activated chloride channel family protein
MKRAIGLLAALTLIVAACGDDDAAITSRRLDPTTYAPTTAAAFEDAAGLPAGGTANPNDEAYDLTFFQNYGVNPRIDTIDDALSTFGLDVDTGSYTVGRRWLSDGNLPDPDSVRVEEYVNYFDPGYQAGDGTFSIFVDGGPTPFAENDRYQIVRIGLQGKVVADEDRPRANLVFVIDVSGSMDREDRLETVKEALAMLVEELRPDDTVGIVVYGSRGQVILEPTPAEESGRIQRAIARLRPDGSTNAEEGLALGYEMASEMHEDGIINRVILASDGVANVGNTGPDSILESIAEHAASGIQLVTVGFGMGNYNDVLMEQLADDGDGFYAYVDDLEEAERLFVHGLTGTLFTIASEARVQVEFDAGSVERWRLIGFENRAIEDDDFRDDAVDAGEIGAGHHVTALYEVRLAPEAAADARLGTVHLRWLEPDATEGTEMSADFFASDLAGSFADASPRFQLAATVATYAEVLRGSYWAQHLTLDDVAGHAERLADLLDDGDVDEWRDLVVTAATLSG